MGVTCRFVSCRVISSISGFMSFEASNGEENIIKLGRALVLQGHGIAIIHSEGERSKHLVMHIESHSIVGIDIKLYYIIYHTSQVQTREEETIG